MLDKYPLGRPDSTSPPFGKHNFGKTLPLVASLKMLDFPSQKMPIFAICPGIYRANLPGNERSMRAVNRHTC